MKKSLMSILVIMTALMLSSCGKDKENTDNQFGIYSAFITDRNNPAPLRSTDGFMDLYLYSDGTYEVKGGNINHSDRFTVNGSVLNLANFGQGVPMTASEAGVAGFSPFSGSYGTGTQNYGACIDTVITSGQYHGSNNYNAYNQQNNFASNNKAFFCR